MAEPTRKNIQPSDATLQVTLRRGVTGMKQNQRDTVRSLGLKRIGQTVTRKADAATVGMINSVPHLVSVEEVDNG